MANSKEILSRIKSIQDTMKITNAMYLISSSKLKKAKKNLQGALPFFETMQKTIAKILDHIPDIQHEYFDTKDEIPDDEKKRAYIVITGDKGLCGAYNHNVNKKVEEEFAKGKNNTLFIVGETGRRYFAKKNVNVNPDFTYSAQEPNIHRARAITTDILDLYLEGQIDEVYIIYTKMVSSMKEETAMYQLLPLKKGHFAGKNQEQYSPLVEFIPSPEAAMSRIVSDYILGIIYGTLVESYASEQNARMTAMDSSTNNAQEMLKDLVVEYNRARQAAITQEITEIVGGARALKKKG